MNCPHCGAEPSNIPGVPVFECLTYCDDTSDIGTTCYERQISQLKAELEQAKADRARAAMQERNKYLAKLSQCVRRDDPRLRDVEDRIRQAIQMADNDIKGLEDYELKKHATVIHMQAAAFLAFEQLQSIIEGK